MRSRPSTVTVAPGSNKGSEWGSVPFAETEATGEAEENTPSSQPSVVTASDGWCGHRYIPTFTLIVHTDESYHGLMCIYLNMHTSKRMKESACVRKSYVVNDIVQYIYRCRCILRVRICTLPHYRQSTKPFCSNRCRQPLVIQWFKKQKTIT